MALFRLEHSKAAYYTDFAIYGAAVVALTAFLLLDNPPAEYLQIAALAALGLIGWSAIEYAMHRFLLHGLQPFRRWHEMHHERPSALIGTPTIISASLIGLLVFLPARLFGSLWPPCALTLGVLAGYFGYAVTHHATHHWYADNAWLKRRKRWHALHHHQTEHHPSQPGCYGVTSSFWDHVFGTLRQPPKRSVQPPPSAAPGSRTDNHQAAVDLARSKN